MDNHMDLMYQGGVYLEEEYAQEAMMEHVSVAAAVLRFERGMELHVMNGTPIAVESQEDVNDNVLMEQKDNENGTTNCVAHKDNENGTTNCVAVLQSKNCETEQLKVEKPNEYLRFVLRMGFGALLHPYEYTKVLMQLGYEPLPLIVSKSFLGRSTQYLPSVHDYVRFIKQTDGIVGLYRGLGSRIISCATAALFSESLVNIVGMSRYKPIDGEKYPFKKYSWNLLRDGVVVITGLIFSHPFYVISVRQMGQFIGREIAYSGICDSLREILKQDGIMGLYAGFVPRMFCDLGVLVATSTLSAICNRIFKIKSTQKEYNSVLFQFAAAMIFYPLQVVAACMACSGSGIAAGAPPFMPIYGQWTDCLTDLVARGDHFRGDLIFRRTLPRLQMHRMYDIFPISRMI